MKTSLPCPDIVPLRLQVDPLFRPWPCEAKEGDELYPNGIFEFNITRLLNYIFAAARFRAELVALEDMPYARSSANLNELTIGMADLSRPVILAEIAPGQYNLIDGHHPPARARREAIESIPAYRVPCPEHVAFLTSTRDVRRVLELKSRRPGRRSSSPGAACPRTRRLTAGVCRDHSQIPEHGPG